jgi:hypothetical protein
MTQKAIIITSIGIVVGAISGYLYYPFVGCASGSCTITSKPLNSTLYGSLLGGLLFNMFVKEEKKYRADKSNIKPFFCNLKSPKD